MKINKRPLSEAIESDGRPDWDLYFLTIASAVSLRSTCLRRSFGSLITKNNEILTNYDLVLFMDVIEHVKREKGLEMLKKARHWIVSTPNYVSGQGAMFGNEYEAHISEWSQNDFKKSVIISGRWIIGYQLP